MKLCLSLLRGLFLFGSVSSAMAGQNSDCEHIDADGKQVTTDCTGF